MEGEVLEVFNEKALKNAIYSALLMSLIDGYLHENEWDIIQSFADTHWREEYENFDQYKDEVKHEINQLLSKTKNEKEVIAKRVQKIVEELTPDLTHQQKNIVLNLVGDVMIADGIMTLEESKLFQVFMEKLGIQI